MRRAILPVATVLCAACSNTTAPTQAATTNAPPVSVPAPVPPVGTNGANWSADAVVISAEGSGGCGWGLSPGETRSGMLWKITIAGTMVALDEDMPNWPTDDIPYAGSLNGMLFEASDVESGGGVCAFRGGTLSGRFSEDGLAFDADETVEWGSSTHPTIVRRRWTGHKL